MKELPDDLATMETDDVVQQGVVRDELLAPLFRRWPRLSRIELRQLKNLYAERVRIAKYRGRLGGRLRRAEPRDSEVPRDRAS
jgi:hypothetical protein